MADLSDVESVLVAVIGAALYPGGVPSGSAPVSPIAGKPTRVYRDWPVKDNLDRDLAAGIVNVSVFSQPNVTHRDSRYPRRWQPVGAKAQPTITWSISGNAATLGGAVLVPQNVALIVDGQDVVYSVQQGDTLTTIATALAALLLTLNAWTVSSSGPAITIGGAHSIVGHVGAVQAVSKEVRRQSQGVMVTAWCADPNSRDAVCAAIDGALAPLNFLTLPDGSAARIQYRSTASSDEAENADLFRRDMVYVIEYATTQAGTAPQVTVVRTTIQAGSQEIANMTPTDPPPFKAANILVELEAGNGD